ncbi:MAG: hypothetical protein V6011_00285 [Candidatus Dasytiphilus stammeri]
MIIPIYRYNLRRNPVFHYLPFWMFNLWTAFELSWLKYQVRSVVAIGEFAISAQSSYIIIKVKTKP